MLFTMQAAKQKTNYQYAQTLDAYSEAYSTLLEKRLAKAESALFRSASECARTTRLKSNFVNSAKRPEVVNKNVTFVSATGKKITYLSKRCPAEVAMAYWDVQNCTRCFFKELLCHSDSNADALVTGLHNITESQTGCVTTKMIPVLKAALDVFEHHNI